MFGLETDHITLFISYGIHANDVRRIDISQSGSITPDQHLRMSRVGNILTRCKNNSKPQ